MNTKAKAVSDFAAEQWKMIASVVGAALVIVALMGVWNEFKSRRDREATSLLFEAQVKARVAMEQKRVEDAEAAYRPLLEKFPTSRAAYEGQLQLGDLWMDKGDYARAISHYEQAARVANDAFSRLLATYTLGVAKESAGKFQEAVADYDTALSSQGSDFLKPEILMAQARCYEEIHQAQKAIEIYKTVQEKFPTRAYYSGAASAFEKQLSAKQL
jgi:tetratricopeptide (TPR) repeat protein